MTPHDRRSRLTRQIFIFATALCLALPGRAAEQPDLRPALKLMDGGEPRAAIELTLKHAESGDGFAQYIVGKSYMLENDHPQGIRWLTASSAAGDPFGMMELAKARLEGQGVEKDVALAIELLERVGNSNHQLAKLAQSRLGRIYETAEHGVEDLDKAVAWHLKSAQAGFSVSQWALAHLQYFRLRKPDNTVSWAGLAAAQSFKPAYMLLGLIHYNGFGTPRNYVEALRWLTRAYEENSARVAYEIGSIHSSGGYGVQRDVVQAVSWYQKGVEQNDPYALLAFSRALVRGVEVPRDEKLAFEYASRSSAANHSPADAYLGTLYVRGIGTPADPQQGFVLFEKSAKNGSVLGMVELGLAYAHGIGTPQDFSSAMEWFQKAAALGYARSFYEIGRLYDHGKGVEASRPKASKWFMQSAQGNFASAQFVVGRALMQSRTDDLDVSAYFWLTLATQGGVSPARKLLAELSGRMSPEQVSRAMGMVSRFKPQRPKIPAD